MREEEADLTTHLAPRLLTQNLLASDPTVLVNEVDPVLENLETEIVVPRSDDQQVESFVPIESSREETTTRGRGEQLLRIRQLGLGVTATLSGNFVVVVPLVGKVAVDDGRAVEVSDATDEVGGDVAGEGQMGRGEGRGEVEGAGESIQVGCRGREETSTQRWSCECDR